MGHHVGEAAGAVAVVDELYFGVMATCASASKQPLACGDVSQEFSAVWAAFGALVPWMCPGCALGPMDSLPKRSRPGHSPAIQTRATRPSIAT
jgi:hypothetical protein